MKARIFLFDLDGVLLSPGGYRAAVHLTMDHFLQQMGAGTANLEERDITLFESLGITSEWDMVPISLAMVWEEILKSTGRQVTLPSWSAALRWAATVTPGNFRPDYQKSIKQLEPLLKKGTAPAEALYDAARIHHTQGLLDHVADQPFLGELLGRSRSVERSPVTRIFQNLVLGSEYFERTYQCKAELDTRSTLKMFDAPIIEKKNCAIIRQLQQTGGIRSAVLTARPSLPPLDQPIGTGYSPEAELALELLALECLPLIGYGRLAYLSEKTGASPETYLKPSPVQALAAIAAAWTGQETAALIWAEPYQNGKGVMDLAPFPALPDEMGIEIFEDTPIGIQSVRQAGEILSQMGKRINFRAWGIASDGSKTAALRANGAAVVNNINVALEQAFPTP
jgi:hypothetical protein